MELLRVLLYAVQEYTFLKFAEICVAILDENVIFYFIFKIFRKKSGISGNIFKLPFFMIFVSRPNYRTGCRNVSHCQQEQCYSGLRSPVR